LQEAEMAFDKGENMLDPLLSLTMLLSRSHNLTELLNDVTAHAEMQAMQLQIILEVNI
jgi:tRNA(adenine34) deaminase